jgi:hypothetical protein
MEYTNVCGAWRGMLGVELTSSIIVRNRHEWPYPLRDPTAADKIRSSKTPRLAIRTLC